MKPQSRRIGQIIREARKARGMTQMKLSELVGVSYQQVQKYEKGSDISVKRLKQIAKAVNMPIAQFVTAVEKVSEEREPYIKKLPEEEALLLELYRRIRSRKAKKAVIELLKTFTA